MPEGKSRLHHTGWLTKRGQKRKNWKRRWHVLDPEAQTLSYGEAPGADPIKTISLSSGARVLPEAECEREIGAADCFAVATPDLTLFLREADAKSRAEWMRFIGIVCNMGGGGGGGGGGGEADVDNGAPSPHAAKALPSSPQATAGPGSGGGGPSSHGGWAPGGSTSHTSTFHAARAMALQRRGGGGGGGGGGSSDDIEDARIRVRVEKLLSPPAMSPFSSRAKFEQSVVPWDRRQLPACPRCSTKFALMGSRRRANCRLCGGLVCEDDACSLPVELNQIAKLLRLPESAAGEVAVRVCAECKSRVERSTSRVASASVASRTSELYRAVRDARDRVDATLADVVALSGYPKPKRLTPAESNRLRELVAQVEREVQLAKAAAAKMAGLPESARGKRRRIADSVVAAANAWALHQSQSLRLYTFAK